MVVRFVINCEHDFGMHLIEYFAMHWLIHVESGNVKLLHVFDKPKRFHFCHSRQYLPLVVPEEYDRLSINLHIGWNGIDIGRWTYKIWAYVHIFWLTPQVGIKSVDSRQMSSIVLCRWSRNEKKETIIDHISLSAMIRFFNSKESLFSCGVCFTLRIERNDRHNLGQDLQAELK